jgi:hypothetical protein
MTYCDSTDRRAREPLADIACRAPTVVRVAGRHPDIRDDDVGPVPRHLTEKILRVDGLGDDIETSVAQKSYETRAQQRLILGDYDSHRSSACTCVPISRCASSRSRRRNPLACSCDGRN